MDLEDKYGTTENIILDNLKTIKDMVLESLFSKQDLFKMEIG
jgi:hypothetical protein